MRSGLGKALDPGDWLQVLELVRALQRPGAGVHFCSTDAGSPSKHQSQGPQGTGPQHQVVALSVGSSC